MRVAPVVSTLALACVLAAPARAAVVEVGEDVPPVSHAPMGKVAVRRGVQGPAGLFTARLNLLVNASDGSFGKPTSLAPDLYYALSDVLQLGLLHTGPMGWQTLPGAGLCLTGTGRGGCPYVYDNVGADVLYGLVYGDFHLSLHTSLYAAHLHEPRWFLWTIGLAGKVHFGESVALFFDPQIGVTLSNRDLYKDQLFVPLALQLQAGPAVSVELLSGVTGQLSALGDTVRAPLGVGVVGNLSAWFDLGLRFSFDNLLGHQPAGASRTAERSLGLLAIFRD